jgi:hypothetical protein
MHFEFVTVTDCSHPFLIELARDTEPLAKLGTTAIDAIATTNQRRSEYDSLCMSEGAKDQDKLLARELAVRSARLSERNLGEPLYRAAREALITLKALSGTEADHMEGDAADWQAFKINYSHSCSWLRTAIKLCYTFDVRGRSGREYWSDRDRPLPHKGLPFDVQKQGLSRLDVIVDESFRFARNWVIACPRLPEFREENLDVIKALLECLSNHASSLGPRSFLHEHLPYDGVNAVLAMLHEASWTVTEKTYNSGFDSSGEYYETTMPATV